MWKIRFEAEPFRESRLAAWMNRVFEKNGGKLSYSSKFHELNRQSPIVHGNWKARLIARIYVAIRTWEQNREVDKVRKALSPIVRRFLNRPSEPWHPPVPLIGATDDYEIWSGTQPAVENQKPPIVSDDWIGRPDDPDRQKSS